MKLYSKLLVMVAMVAAGFTMMSCSSEDEGKNPPILKITQTTNSGYIEFTVKCLVVGEAASLKSMEILLDGQPAYDAVLKKEWTGTDSKTTTGALSGKEKNLVVTFDNAINGKTLKFNLTDKDGEIVSQTLTAKSVSTESDLLVSKDFTWLRVAGSAATGLGQFGLEWTSNTDKVAIIKKSGTNKLVSLSGADWDAIKTKEALKSKVDAAAGIDTYEKISVTADKTYTGEVLATQVGTSYYILKINSSAVRVLNEGTEVTVKGNYKE